MNKWKPALALVLVFAAGVVLGVVATQLVVRQVIHNMVAKPEVARNVVRDRVEMNLARRLRLEPLQQQRVNQILRESHEQLAQLRGETQPRFAQISSNTESQIMALLTPEQQREFERLKLENPRIIPGAQPPPRMGGPRGGRRGGPPE